MRISDWSSDVCSSDLILGEMSKALAGTRQEMSAHAPRIETMQIPKDKIREVIGTGGKVIREIVATTGAKVDIDDEGLIKIWSSDLTQLEAARHRTEARRVGKG